MSEKGNSVAKKRILFAGYAPVHVVCFLPVYQRLVRDARVELFLSGGFKSLKHGQVHFSTEGFYDEFPVDRERILDADTARCQSFDALVCAHLSDTLFPRSVGRSVQIFHGVSFKNLAVRDKALRYDFLCLPGQYHADLYRKQGLVRPDETTVLVTGFPKIDPLVTESSGDGEILRRLGMSTERPTLLFAPTGDKHNSLEVMGRDLIRHIAASGSWNLLVKPHDHPKNETDWFSELADLEGPRVRLVREKDIVPYLKVADLLLTDASSVALEYTLLNRPIVFLDVPKLLKRLAKRAPALDLDTYGRRLGVVVQRPQDAVSVIADCLAHPDRESPLRSQAARHLFHAPGGGAERVAGVILHAAGGEADLPRGVEVVAPV